MTKKAPISRNGTKSLYLTSECCWYKLEKWIFEVFRGSVMEKSLKGKKFFTFGEGLTIFTGILLVLLVVFSCNNVLIIGGGG